MTNKINFRISSSLKNRMDKVCKLLDVEQSVFIRKSFRKYNNVGLNVNHCGTTKETADVVVTVKNWGFDNASDADIRNAIEHQVKYFEEHPPVQLQIKHKENHDYILEENIDNPSTIMNLFKKFGFI